MGLTLHYELAAGEISGDRARTLMESLRTRASELPFQRVSNELLSLTGRACGLTGAMDEWRQVKNCAARVLQRGDNYYSIPPDELFAFHVLSAPGCELAFFGLCRYPERIQINGEDLPTDLSGWSWSAFCKTQYASNPADGGVKNFIRCHISLVHLLDAADRLGILRCVLDDSDYWSNRDPQALELAVQRWNRLIAGVAGKLKDQLGSSVQATITDYPNFEHLEAEGEAEGKRRDER